MRIAFLAARKVIHTVKWVNEFARRGHEVHLITMHDGGDPLEESVHVHVLPFAPPVGYYLNAPVTRKLLRELKPDVVNAHYASGYGTLARLSGYRPLLLSVWGSDVYDFPYKSFVHRALIRRNLAAADRIASTSHAMKQQTERLYRPKYPIAVTPFGVDCTKFSPRQNGRTSSVFRIGTVKALKPKYGIDDLIRAFALARDAGLGASELIIAGEGPQEAELRELAQTLGVAESVRFLGRVAHAEVPKVLNSLDVFVALSILDSESFGVAVVEASACGLPVVVSDVGGLPEVVVHGSSGFIVPKRDPAAAAARILELARDEGLRNSMGSWGRQFILSKYEWSHTADEMEEVLTSVARSRQ